MFTLITISVGVVIGVLVVVFLVSSRQISDSETDWPDAVMVTGFLKEDRRQNSSLRGLINAGNALSQALLTDVESFPTARRRENNPILVLPHRWYEGVSRFQMGFPTKEIALSEMIKEGAFIAKLMSHDQRLSSQWDRHVFAIKGANGQPIHLS